MRRPYFGSCHCGTVRYIVYLTLPMQPPYNWTDKTEPPPQMARKCNCNVCHKTGMSHLRLANAPSDFMLLSPLDPLRAMGNYLTKDKNMNLLFCQTCAVRPFVIEGPPDKELGFVVEKDLEAEGIDLSKARIGLDYENQGAGITKTTDGKTKVWVPNPDGWQEEVTHWLRINAQTLDAGQDGLDIAKWHEKKWIQYVNWLDEDEGAASYEKPFHSGTY
jgi:hypothetical protein